MGEEGVGEEGVGEEGVGEEGVGEEGMGEEGVGEEGVGEEGGGEGCRSCQCSKGGTVETVTNIRQMNSSVIGSWILVILGL
jgi:hypothetical protein